MEGMIRKGDERQEQGQQGQHRAGGRHRDAEGGSEPDRGGAAQAPHIMGDISGAGRRGRHDLAGAEEAHTSAPPRDGHG